ncbi:MAG: hypothetical protein IPM42_11805 [Saprospiraceae bacterium]|nr:hypothetical protein [Saprospiraceae bacterium]
MLVIGYSILNKINKYVIPLIAVLVLSFSGISQSLPKTSSLTTENGLGYRDVTSIAVDSAGLIWIGSPQGLERYDGTGFVRFNKKKSADIYFPGEAISPSGIIFNEKNKLIAIADEKLFYLDITKFSTHELKIPLDSDYKILNIIPTKNEKLYLIGKTATELTLFSHDKSGFKNLAQARKGKINLNSSATDSYDNIWWSTPMDGIFKLNFEGKIQEIFKLDSIDWYDSRLFSSPIFIDKSDRIFVFPKSVNQVWQFFPEKNEKIVILDNLRTPVYYGIEDTQGDHWFAGKKQLIRYRVVNNQAEVTDFTDHISKEFNFTQINALAEDKNKILWIGTNNGIIQLPLGEQLINNYLVMHNQEWGNEMRGIFEANDGSIYAYCENGSPGLYKINLKTEKSEKIKTHFSGKSSYDLLENGKHFIYDRNADKCYFLTDFLYSINMKNYEITQEGNFSTVTEKFNKNPVNLLKDGELILGSELTNIIIYNPVLKTKKRFFNSAMKNDGIKVSCFKEDKDGHIWIGTSFGIFVTSRSGRILHHFHTESKPGLNNNNILTINIDKNENVWIGTFGGGVNIIKASPFWYKSEKIRLFTQDYSIQSITKEDGLCNENVPGILEDDFGNLWFATYDGLVCYNPAKKSFRTYNRTDGISNNEFNYTSVLKQKNGMLWFGGLNGLNKINPAQIVPEKNTPELILLSFTKYDKKNKIPEKTIFGNSVINESYIISPSVNWFQFNWSLPSYVRTNNNNYHVKMEGIDEQWNYLGNNAFVRYNSLPYGEYTLHIKGSDSNGNESPNQLSIPIIVLRAYYQTWWFYSLILMSLSGIIYLIFRYNLLKKLEMERMRTQIASDLHDEVGSMLSGLAMQSELLQSYTGVNKDSGLKNIAHISRSVVGKMRDLVWSIDSRRDSFGALVDRMKEQAADLFQNKDISYHFEIGDISLNKELPVFIRQQLFLIYSEAITNVSRHSNADHVQVRIGNFNNEFELSIRDNGKPSDKPGHTTGMGKANMEMRAKKLGATIHFEQRNGFCVQLKMKKL